MENLFTKIKSSRSLSQEIEAKIEELIIQRKLVPGQKLPTESELCALYGVSRTALREALQVLNARDLISIRKGSGMYINEFDYAMATKSLQFFLNFKFDKDYMMQIVTFRYLFEPQIARLAARNRSKTDIDFLRASIVKMKNAEDLVVDADTDRYFHTRIAEASGNPVIPLMFDPIYRLMPRIKSLTYAYVKTAKRASLDFHQKICDRIDSQDEDGAYQVMQNHLESAMAHTKCVQETDLKKATVA